MPTLTAPLPARFSLGRNTSTIPAVFAGGLFLFHLVFNLLDSYGLFRDEFYYLACANRLAWGYVDQPPLSIFLLHLQTLVFGDTLVALRLLPAAALAGTVFLTGRMVQHLKGGSTALLLACGAVATAPIYLAMGSYYSMNSLDIFLWSLVAYLLLRIAERATPARWLLLGVIIGLGLLNKVGFLWLGAGLLVGLLLTPLRKELLTPWPYLAAILALLLFSPFLLWNVQHDFAHLEFMRNAIAYKYNDITRLDFIKGILLQLNPLSVLLWLPGLFYLLLHQSGKKAALLGYLFVTSFLILFMNGHSKSEYLAPAFPMLFAAGAVWLEQRLLQNKQWLLWALLALIMSTGLLLAPIARPVMPVNTFIAYSAALGVAPANSEGKALKELPQFYADRFGWEEMAQTVSGVYQSLAEEEKQQTAIYTQNYGEAGALEYYQEKYPLPPVISGHNAYWLWGYGPRGFSTLIIVGGNRKDHLDSFYQVEQLAVHASRYAMPYEDNLPVFLCRQPKSSFSTLWPHTKNYN